MLTATSSILRSSLRASTSSFRAFSTSLPAKLATPAEQQADASNGGSNSKPTQMKDFKIYRWVSNETNSI